jgi:hypothetical protein
MEIIIKRNFSNNNIKDNQSPIFELLSARSEYFDHIDHNF